MNEEFECEVKECKRCNKGLPLWLTTYADLMSLLMCFFVLLLSFAEIDILKYKQVAGAMQAAFGVQPDVNATQIPRGTHVIAQHYSYGTPIAVTPLKIMRENTTDATKTNLDFTDSTNQNNQSLSLVKAKAITYQHARQMAADESKELKRELASAIKNGLLEVEGYNDRVLIRIRENGSFGSGQAKIKAGFEPILQQIADVLYQRDGYFVITGHTDDNPIENSQFRSNWDLSAKRAASVLHFFIRLGQLDPERMEIRARSDNQPLVPNDSRENRALNRRVDISVLHGNTKPIQLNSPSESVEYVK